MFEIGHAKAAEELINIMSVSKNVELLELEFRQRANTVIEEAVAKNECTPDDAPESLLEVLRCAAEAALYVVKECVKNSHDPFNFQNSTRLVVNWFYSWLKS